MDAKPGQKVGLTCKVDEDMEGILMCTLREGGCESQVGCCCALPAKQVSAMYVLCYMLHQ